VGCSGPGGCLQPCVRAERRATSRLPRWVMVRSARLVLIKKIMAARVPDHGGWLWADRGFPSCDYGSRFVLGGASTHSNQGVCTRFVVGFDGRLKRCGVGAGAPVNWSPASGGHVLTRFTIVSVPASLAPTCRPTRLPVRPLISDCYHVWPPVKARLGELGDEDVAHRDGNQRGKHRQWQRR